MNPSLGSSGRWVWCFLLTVAVLAAADDPLESVEKRSEAWVQTRVETSRLEESWITERALLESTLAGYKERIAVLREKQELALAKTAKEREEVATLQAKAKSGRAELQSFETRLKALQVSLLQLRPFLPPRLSAGLDFAYRSLTNPELTAGERMQLSMTVLNRCAQFNRTLTCGEDILTLDTTEGAKAVPVIYWGLSHGYALDPSSGQAWLGRPGKDGWQWEKVPEAAPAVAKLIAIYHDKSDPEFVSVPAKLNPARSEPETK